MDPDACEQIGDFYITGLPVNLAAGSPVEVTYAYDANGRIHCSAMELTSKQVASIEIVRAGLQTKDVDVFAVLARDYHVE
jgi:molecular chaperone DnaK